MATFKAIIEPHYKRTDGTYNIKIRVTHNTKKTYISTQWYVTKADLRSNLEIKSTYYKDLVEKKIHEYRKICNSIKDIDSISVKEIADLLRDSQGVDLNIQDPLFYSAVADKV
jgi:hypothetical protein